MLISGDWLFYQSKGIGCRLRARRAVGVLLFSLNIKIQHTKSPLKSGLLERQASYFFFGGGELFAASFASLEVRFRLPVRNATIIPPKPTVPRAPAAISWPSSDR